MKVLKIVTIVGLTAYGLRIVQGLGLGYKAMDLLPYASAWVSWIGLASWQWTEFDWTTWEKWEKWERITTESKEEERWNGN